MEEKNFSKEFFFTFRLGTGMFAVPVGSVKEVLNYEPVTSVPNAQPYLKGVINVRGAVITVADFRVLFGFDSDVPIEKNSIIVAEIERDDDQPLVLGILADSVDAVCTLQPIPSGDVNYGTIPSRREFISCVMKRDSTFFLMLDLKKILSSIKKELDQSF